MFSRSGLIRFQIAEINPSGILTFQVNWAHGPEVTVGHVLDVLSEEGSNT